MTIKKEQKNLLIGLGIFILVILILTLIRTWRMSNVEKMMQGAELPYGLLEEAVSYDGDSYLVPPTQIYESGSELPALTNPDFDTVAQADAYLADDIPGVDVEVNGQHRFYSYQILNWHEVVNDTFGEVDLAVTHCSFCKSSAVYDRNVDGKTLEFENSGLVYNNNQLLESNDESLWIQLSGKAISGKYLGEKLNAYQFNVLTWAQWSEHYPNGEVLSTDTGYVRDYGMHPNQNYDVAKTIYYPMNVDIKYMAAKWDIDGLAINNDAIAFSDDIMKGMYAANEVVDGMSIVGFWNEDLKQTFIYASQVNDQVLTFSYDFNTQTMTDDQTGSTWNSNGLALSGSLTGTQLTRIQTRPSFWMCWYAIYPQTQIAFIDTASDNTDEAEQGSSLEINSDTLNATLKE
ncbi:MAG: hypothetical protein UU40_C0002G0021 [Candidatus Uhrbacteria bacterium GW2011_GWD2_41_121]|uniref:DUF3179 domain-containing protein n=1 Tax=Candidatus Uhrbacteria bacterium GW2011_GWC1_41_20 TaxID=1618983 RepID=A0A0G0VFU7_9BACT|nr:MAG: hypothetical protein UT52_C0002G0021 [Candidatus Uhrbacteria bacterium GW2011_GWE1_39_46]KKR64504.1 MAG: hypothetical protein UU04_C0001G0021 [Candidatus Uhrbacteria bacterium GW2011_GWC2_40_450]KKR88635.1 MAG: hypothetical protein UU36_C0041G0005 [Candidatus Uhrbacteria bacterium GW2011_GWE2_41_1153]KKR90576.1 MAG: hypothetical protein UU40_C0002G0021 [Candidatus Uhrbacteria bacterium GW2011_GWD2_41_121]KKR96487.1 MAG: hypothetical protein UU46_C0002G0023 [Candidatus Uhrbacteria bacter